MLIGTSRCNAESAATQTAADGAVASAPAAAPGQQEAGEAQGARKGREKGAGVGTWIRLPHMPSLRVTRPQRPDLPPVPVRVLINMVCAIISTGMTARVFSTILCFFGTWEALTAQAASASLSRTITRCQHKQQQQRYHSSKGDTDRCACR